MIDMTVEAIIDDCSLDNYDVGEIIGKCNGQIVGDYECGKRVLVKPDPKLCDRCAFGYVGCDKSKSS